VSVGTPGRVPPDRRLGGGFAVQVHVADRPAVDQGDQQDPDPGSLAGQAAGEEVPLPQRHHQRGQVGVGPGPDLHGSKLAGPHDHVTAISPP
jgi:hypothetical protein